MRLIYLTKTRILGVTVTMLIENYFKTVDKAIVLPIPEGPCNKTPFIFTFCYPITFKFIISVSNST